MSAERGAAATPAEPALDARELAALARGVEQFNTGHFFECHDTLEELWSGIRGESRDFFQALIQVAVAFYHLSCENRGGASSMLGRALERFAPYPARYFGFELAAHRAELEAWLARIAEGELEGLTLADLPKWRFEGVGRRAGTQT